MALPQVLTSVTKAERDYIALSDLPENRLTASLSPQQREKLFWLGLVEGVPLFAGAVFSIYTDSKLYAVIAAFVAVAVTALICWLLRHQVPPTPIELSAPGPDQALEPTPPGLIMSWFVVQPAACCLPRSRGRGSSPSR